jgi:hypothetical protein
MEVANLLCRPPEPLDQTTKGKGLLGDDEGPNTLWIVQELGAYA